MRVLLWLGSSMVLLACGGGSTSDAGAGLSDAGGADAATGRDAGPSPGDDAGPMSTDAGSDAGPMSSDAGSPSADAGTDAGPISPDAGRDAGPPATDAGTDASARLPTGTSGCASDAECADGVCWDFNAHDSLCFGTVCSLACASDLECQDAARAAGAGSPERASGGTDAECDFVGTGLGLFACA